MDGSHLIKNLPREIRPQEDEYDPNGSLLFISDNLPACYLFFKICAIVLLSSFLHW